MLRPFLILDFSKRYDFIMDFILYNSSVDSSLDYIYSSDETDLNNLAFQHGEIEKLVDMDTVIVMDSKNTDMEEMMK